MTGFPVRRGEVISIDASPATLARAEALGFRVIEAVRLQSLDISVVRLRAAEGVAAADALHLLRANAPGAMFELDHYFTVGGEAEPRTGKRVPSTARAVDRNSWIGMIDTAVVSTPSTRSLHVERHDLVASAASLPEASAHGTAVAYILAQQGVARLTSVNVFSADARPFASADAIARAVDWLASRHVPVINVSIAGPRNELVDRVIGAATAHGIIVVAAAGNGGPAALPAYPAASRGAVAVTAVDASDQIYLHANRGPYIAVAARGVDVPAALGDGTLRSFSGTSFAAPVIAAYLSRCARKQSTSRATQCIARMQKEARDLGAPGRDPVYGYGLISR